MAGAYIQYPDRLEAKYEYSCLVGQTLLRVKPTDFPDHWLCTIYISGDRHEESNKLPLWHADVPDWIKKHAAIDVADHMWIAKAVDSDPPKE